MPGPHPISSTPPPRVMGGPQAFGGKITNALPIAGFAAPNTLQNNLDHPVHRIDLASRGSLRRRWRKASTAHHPG